MTEEWRAIPGHVGYEVSDQGRVRSVDRVIVDRRGRQVRRQGQLLSGSIAVRGGYRIVRLGHVGDHSVHKLVLLAFVGPRPAGLEVRHLNGDPTDARLVNLTYGTSSENNLDQVRHGTHPEATRETCPFGHAYEGRNLVPSNRGRSCLACSRGWNVAKHRGDPEQWRPLADAYHHEIATGDVSELVALGVNPWRLLRARS